MSISEHYTEELSRLDHEIMHYAAVCGVDLSNRGEINACLLVHHESDWINDKARESLRGLLLLRNKVEEKMIESGLKPPLLMTPEAD